MVEKSFFLFWSLYGCGDFSPTERDHPLPLASEHLCALPLFGGQDGLPLGAIELLLPTPQPESVIVTCFGHRVVLYENSELSLLFCV